MKLNEPIIFSERSMSDSFILIEWIFSTEISKAHLMVKTCDDTFLEHF